MFHSLGYFKQVQCPNQHDCKLQNCIFSHESTDQRNGPAGGEVYDPFSAGDVEPPPSKRRKMHSLETKSMTENDTLRDSSAVVLSQRTLPVPAVDRTPKKAEIATPAFDKLAKENSKSTKSTQPASIRRPISPPPKRETKAVISQKIEKLIPRPVAQSPAVLKVRMSLIEMLFKQMNILNSQIDAKDPVLEHLVLNEQQIIKWVLDEEEQAAAKLASDIYRNAMSQKVVQFRRMKLEDWKKFVNENLNPSNHEKQKGDEVSTGLSPEEEIQILKYLRTNLTGLDSHGYVTKPPSTADIQKAKDTIRMASGYELCDRCGVRFQVFPGRNEQGQLTTKGECYYHWGKLNKSPWQKTDHVTGQSQSSFPCCGQLPGSEGCTQAATHVFKVADPKRLASLLQFEQTPMRSDGKKRGPVAFDCEMAYTTYGLEVVRVTAVSWPQNKELLDVFVRPFGEILDLNTRFSGVTQEQYANALPYDTARDHNDNTSEEGEIEPEPLRKVDSPAVARRLMFDLLTPETPLIGHAIDNDLNTCRIIHPFVVDTVLLYPHPRGLPIRYGLRVLASKYLHRSIQSGGDSGHDSKEDSIATGDLVRIKVAEKWQMMRLQGWKFNEGSLMPPGR